MTGATRQRFARRENNGLLLAGVGFLALFVVVTMVIVAHPGPNGLDRWGFDTLGYSPKSPTWTHITTFGSLIFLVAGSLAVGVVAGLSQDWWRAAACAGGPYVAVALAQWVIKPEIGRYYEQVLTYPSGSVTVVAALAAAAVVAVPGVLRWPVGFFGLVAIALESLAVVALRWHYPSDALGGALLGNGTVLVVAGVLGLLRFTLIQKDQVDRPDVSRPVVTTSLLNDDSFHGARR